LYAEGIKKKNKRRRVTGGKSQISIKRRTRTKKRKGTQRVKRRERKLKRRTGVVISGEKSEGSQGGQKKGEIKEDRNGTVVPVEQ